MNLYLISQDIHGGYDTYDSAVVCAESEEEARNINPGGGDFEKRDSHYPAWVRTNEKDKVKVEKIGTADDGVEKGVVVSSFNAG